MCELREPQQMPNLLIRRSLQALLGVVSVTVMREDFPGCLTRLLLMAIAEADDFPLYICWFY